MKSNTNTPLLLAFIIVSVILFMLGGASIMASMLSTNSENTGVLNNINWLWIPTFLVLIIDVLLGWGLFRKREE